MADFPAPAALPAARAVRIEPTVTAAEAQAVVRRRLGGTAAEAALVHHPFWHVRVVARREPGVLSRLFKRGAACSESAEARAGADSAIDVFVDAKGGTSFITQVPLEGDLVTASAELAEPPGESTLRRARDLAAAALRRRFRLGMNFDLSTDRPRGVLKPNWIVDGSGHGVNARMLVDGFDGSYWVIRADREKQTKAAPPRR